MDEILEDTVLLENRRILNRSLKKWPSSVRAACAELSMRISRRKVLTSSSSPVNPPARPTVLTYLLS